MRRAGHETSHGSLALSSSAETVRPVPASLEILHQLARTCHRLDLVEQVEVQRLLGRPDLIAVLLSVCSPVSTLTS
jgi:hypothetical protein